MARRRRTGGGRGARRAAAAAFVPAALAAALATACRASAAPHAGCASLSAADAFLAVCVQNCFLDRRPAPAAGEATSYGVPPSEVDATGNVTRGSLPVYGSGGVVPVVDAWLAAAAAGGATPLASLDWHSPGHCSFCRYGASGDDSLGCTWGCDAPGAPQVEGVCLSALGVPDVVFDSSGRCVDGISQLDYELARYFQWPDHCVRGSFGARFDARLRVPAGTEVFKLGFENSEDMYSALAGRQGEAAEDGTLDDAVRADEAAFLAERPSLRQRLGERGVRRLFLAGLATDYVVKNTALEALQLAAEGNTALREVVVVNAGSMGVFDAPGDFYGSDAASLSGLAKKAMAEAGARIVMGATVPAALAELCEGTCNDDTDCGAGQVCADIEEGEMWPKCAPASCPVGSVPAVAEQGTSGGLCVPCGAGSFAAAGALNCSACPAGMAQEDDGKGFCTKCRLGEWSEAGAERCTPCAPHASTLQKQSTSPAACECREGYYNATVLDTANRPAEYAEERECMPCPVGGVCAGGKASLPVTLPGYYGFATDPYEFEECENADICPGNFTCGENYRGNLCARCEAGRYRFNGACEECPKVALALSVFGGGALISLWVLINVYVCNLLVHADQVLEFAQLVAVASEVNARWPSVLNAPFLVASLLDFDIDMLSLNCGISQTWGFVTDLTLQLLIIPAIVLGFAVRFALARRLLGRDEPSTLLGRLARALVPRVRTAAELEVLKDSTIASCLEATNLLYVPVCKYALSVFPCQKLAGRPAFLQADPDILCHSSSHGVLKLVGSLGMVLVVLGYPLVVLYAIRRVRSTPAGGVDPVNLRRFGSLYWRYKCSASWFELINVVRRAAFVAISVMIYSPGLQLLLLQIMMQAATMLMLYMRPYHSKDSMLLDSTLSAAMLLLLTSGSYFIKGSKGSDKWGMVLFVVIVAAVAPTIAWVNYRDVRDKLSVLRARVLTRRLNDGEAAAAKPGEVLLGMARMATTPTPAARSPAASVAERAEEGGKAADGGGKAADGGGGDGDDDSHRRTITSVALGARGNMTEMPTAFDTATLLFRPRLMRRWLISRRDHAAALHNLAIIGAELHKPNFSAVGPLSYLCDMDEARFWHHLISGVPGILDWLAISDEGARDAFRRFVEDFFSHEYASGDVLRRALRPGMASQVACFLATCEDEAQRRALGRLALQMVGEDGGDEDDGDQGAPAAAAGGGGALLSRVASIVVGGHRDALGQERERAPTVAEAGGEAGDGARLSRAPTTSRLRGGSARPRGSTGTLRRRSTRLAAAAGGGDDVRPRESSVFAPPDPEALRQALEAAREADRRPLFAAAKRASAAGAAPPRGLRAIGEAELATMNPLFVQPGTAGAGAEAPPGQLQAAQQQALGGAGGRHHGARVSIAMEF